MSENETSSDFGHLLYLYILKYPALRWRMVSDLRDREGAKRFLLNDKTQ